MHRDYGRGTARGRAVALGRADAGALQTGTFDAAARATLARCAVHGGGRARHPAGQQVHAALSRASSQHPGEPADEQHLRAALDEKRNPGPERSPCACRRMKVVACSDLPVLLLGETGVGKELFARFLHRHSPRRGKPLVHVNCAALSNRWPESELLATAGRVLGAVTDRPGALRPPGGTLFRTKWASP